MAQRDSVPGKRVEPDRVQIRAADTPALGAVAPARDIDQAYRFLTWVASRRPSVDEQDQWEVQAVALTHALAGLHG